MLLIPLDLMADYPATFPYFNGTYYDDSPPENPFVPDTIPYNAKDDYIGKVVVSPSAPGSYNTDYWQSPETPQGYADKGPPWTLHDDEGHCCHPENADDDP